MLGAAACRFNVEAVVECPSTNALLSEYAGKGGPLSVPGTVLVADRQTAGRGRRGRSWHSALRDPGGSLTFSLLWRLPSGVSPAGLSLAVGIGLVSAMRNLGCASVALKWPNDLLAATPAGWAKLGGVLIELLGGRAGTLAVVGVGLNLALPDELPPEQRVTGLTQCMGAAPDRHTALAAVLAALLAPLDRFSQSGFAPLRDTWSACNAYAGQPVRLLEDDGHEIHGVCAGVDDDGALLVDTATGRRRWLAGDVSLRGG